MCLQLIQSTQENQKLQNEVKANMAIIQKKTEENTSLSRKLDTIQELLRSK